ncbi:MAG TPA: hypothetical protein VGN16_06615 [Acidobacteriaceae bacterium]|jgi:hypothetical protein
MRRLVLFGLFGFGSLLPLAGVAQSTASGDAFIESRQAEVTQLGSMIYHAHFDDGTWTHRQVAVCPAFTHHVFAHYNHQNSNGPVGEGMTFLAVYSLDSTPAPSPDEPWKGGVILVPLPAVHQGEAVKVTAERPETMTLFNRIWKDELRRSGTPNAFPQLTWQGLAECYARLANEQTLPAQKIGSDSTIDFRYMPVRSLLVPVQGTADHKRWLYLRIDRRGDVVESVVKDGVQRPEAASVATENAPNPPAPTPTVPNASVKAVHGHAAKKRLPVNTVAGTVDSSTLPARTVAGTVDANSLPGRAVAGTVDENGLPVLPAPGVKH